MTLLPAPERAAFAVPERLEVGIVEGGLVAVGEEAQLAALPVLVQDINGVLPGIELGGVEFA